MNQTRDLFATNSIGEAVAPTHAEPKPTLPPFARESETSREAAISVHELAPTLRSEIEAYFTTRGRFGATDDEIEVAFSLRHQTASARCWELRGGGGRERRIVDSGRRRKTRAGRNATVWVHITFAEPTP